MESNHVSNISRVHGAYLPHWTRPGGTYSVTFRLADSLPTEKLEELRWMRKNLEITLQGLRATNDPVAFAREITLWRVYSSRMDAFLDAGSGGCLMNDPRVADIVADALRFFDGTRYVLHVWAVMPNHAHVVFTPLAQHALSEIMKSWKGFTARASNKLLDREGTMWQKEPYDHLVRNEEDFSHHVEYVLKNPEAAGLKNWRWVGVGPHSQGWLAPEDWLKWQPSPDGWV